MPAQDVMEIEPSHVQGAVLDEVALGQGAGESAGLAPDAECRFDADLRVIRGRCADGCGHLGAGRISAPPR